MELDELAPKRVLALTGTWIHPFRDGLNLQLEDRRGLVEEAGQRDGVAWVVAKHPMGKPQAEFVREVLGAYADLGSPIEGG